MRGSQVAAWATAMVLLAGCGTSGADWAKPGVEKAAATREYQDCRAMADAAVRTDVDIDADILATRQSDWQRGGVGRLQSRTMAEHTRGRGAAIVSACMRAKGFNRVP